MVEVTENTAGKWCKEDKWKELKAARNTTRSSILQKKYLLLEKLVDENLKKAHDGTLTNSDIDAEHKLTLSIAALEEEESLGSYIQSFIPFAEWMRKNYPKLAPDFAKMSEEFIMEKAHELS